jgi:cell division protein FtsI (penicillin-binding protein 3)/stage V sporulation protein D (sporulation-specific penicillin-binding protein)
VRQANRRLRLLVAVFAVVFVAAFARVAWLQAVKAQALDHLATSQHRQQVEVPARRGTIFDRNGVQLAFALRGTTVTANPRQIVDPRTTAIAVGEALDLDPGKLYPLLADRSVGFVYLSRKADPEKAEALEAQGIVGLDFEPEERRVYPQRTVASEVVGYAGTDNSGLSGLELQLDDELAGHDGSKTIVRDPFGRTIDVVHAEQVRNGRDVFLTVDHTIQGYVERVLRRARGRWAAQSATAVVLDPRTGGILALAVEPGFDANAFATVAKEDEERLRNRAVTDTYEPGSTFKVVTVGGVLEDDVVTPRTKFRLKYKIPVADRIIHDALPRPTQTMTVSQILSRSSNVGVVTLAQQLQRDRLNDWIRRFGFGKKTGVDFPGESRGIVLKPEEWSGSTIGNVPIGQGIAVTPLQMAAAYGAIANGGVWLQPHLVDRVEGSERVEAKRRQVLSPQTARELTLMLRGVVEDGSGTTAQVDGYRVAGKTGTAAKPEPTGGYSDTRYVASFVGFAPATRPRVVVLVTVDEPRGAIWGGTVAGPVFAEIAQFVLQYLEVPPDGRRGTGG